MSAAQNPPGERWAGIFESGEHSTVRYPTLEIVSANRPRFSGESKTQIAGLSSSPTGLAELAEG